LWKKYNIKIAIDNIASAWVKATQKNMNGVWKALLPKFVHDFVSFDKAMDGIQKKNCEAGFKEVDKEDIQEVLTHTRRNYQMNSFNPTKTEKIKKMKMLSPITKTLQW
jgi:hypothetical protein